MSRSYRRQLSEVAFITEGLPFDGMTVDQRSLGGSETALTYMAREFAKRGHETRVFCLATREDRFDGVQYINLDKWPRMTAGMDLDLLVCSRFPHLASMHPHRSRMTWLWHHDTPAPTPEGWAMYLAALTPFDRFLFVSQYHARLYSQKFPEMDEHSFVTRNGVDRELIERVRALGIKKERKLCVYTSRPERGLYVLLKHVWPRIIERDPEMKLVVTWYALGAQWEARMPENMKALYAACQDLIKASPNVEKIEGGLNKYELYKLVAKAGQVCYPSDFPEVSCLASIEAQLLGTPFVTSDRFALQETVKVSRMRVPGNHSDDPVYVRRFAEIVHELVNNDVTYKGVIEKAIAKMGDDYYWDTIAGEWCDHLEEQYERRRESRSANVVEKLIAENDLIPAEVEAKRDGDESLEKAIRQEIDKRMAHGEDEAREELIALAMGGTSKMDRARHDGRFGQVATWLKEAKSQSLLFLEAGTGEVPRLLAEAVPGLKITAVDPAAENVEAARALASESTQAANLTFLQGSASDLAALAEGNGWGTAPCFDAVYAGELLQTTPDPLGLARALIGLVNKEPEDALAMFSVPCGSWDVGRTKGRAQIVAPEPGQAPRTRDLWHLWKRDLVGMFGGFDGFQCGIVPIQENSRGELGADWLVRIKTNGPQDRDPIEPDLSYHGGHARPANRVSCCMIVKDAMAHLGACLNSVRAVADEFVFVDTGSVDGTPDFLAGFKAGIEGDPWHEGKPVVIIDGSQDFDLSQPPSLVEKYGPFRFDYARNLSSEPATGTHVLWIDADEELLGPEQLHKYLHSPLFNGYVIRQHHVALDAPTMAKKPDLPCRLFRNGQGAQWFGCIHEHVEESLNRPVHPTTLLVDVNILHYGYITEQRRRRKCQHRNLALLMKDRTLFPQRKLGRGLEMRDLVNLFKWRMDDLKVGLVPEIGQDAIDWLREVVDIYKRWYKDPLEPGWSVGDEQYQDALHFLGLFRAGATETAKVPPIQCAVHAQAKAGGMLDHDPRGEPPLVKTERRWFSDVEEFKEHMRKRVELLVAMEGLAP